MHSLFHLSPCYLVEHATKLGCRLIAKHQTLDGEYRQARELDVMTKEGRGKTVFLKRQRKRRTKENNPKADEW